MKTQKMHSESPYVNIRKVAIIGCGFVGAATGFGLLQSGLFSEMVLIDADKDKAEGEALDISHGEPFTRPMEIYAGTYDDIVDASIKLPSALKNVTIKAAGATLKNTTITSADGNSLSYDGLTFDGIIFDNSNIVLTGMRSGSVLYKDLTVTNCVFKNIERTGNYAAIHTNMSTKEAIRNFTFTNNIVDGVTGSSNNALTLKYVTGNITISDNTIKNVALYPFNLMVANDDGIDDNVVIENNNFAGSANGRLQGVGASTTGNDTVSIAINGNNICGITQTYQICFWQFNAEKTTADLSGNYYDIDIVANPGKIYFNRAASSVEDLIEFGVISSAS